jgi:putative ABC transport system permease protein
MFNHIFKLIWKKKKSNFLMMLEIFVSFIILFAVWSLSVYTYRNYALPAGIETENVWTVYVGFNTDSDSVQEKSRDILHRTMQGIREVESFAFADIMPYGFSTSNSRFSHGGRSAMSNMFEGDAAYAEVLGLKMSSGRWFTAEDTIGKQQPVVITRHLAEELFGGEDAVGKRLGEEEEKDRRKVVGVVDYFRHSSSFQADNNAIIMPADKKSINLLVKLAGPQNADFEARLAKTLQQAGQNWSVEIQHLDKMKATQDKLVLIPILILFVLCGFLVFNVGLGLFGVLFQNISRRKGEIGLRRAVGASRGQILGYFIGETLVIAGFAVVLGVFFAIQAPLLNLFDVEAGVYFTGILLAIVSIFCLAVLCAFYPSRQAAAIYPAVALHEE